MFQYDERRATSMSVAIAEMLSKVDVQVLWKFSKLGEFPDDNLLSRLLRYKIISFVDT